MRAYTYVNDIKANFYMNLTECDLQIKNSSKIFQIEKYLTVLSEFMYLILWTYQVND